MAFRKRAPINSLLKRSKFTSCRSAGLAPEFLGPGNLYLLHSVRIDQCVREILSIQSADFTQFFGGVLAGRRIPIGIRIDGAPRAVGFSQNSQYEASPSDD